MRAMRYSLWNAARTAQVAPAQKVGFCLYDLEDAPGFTGTQDPEVYNDAVTDYCEEGNPASTSLRMGVSAGWRDVYSQALAFQWIDVSDTAPGTYVVGAEADPDNGLWEGRRRRRVNAPAFRAQTVTVPGCGGAAGRDPSRPAPRRRAAGGASSAVRRQPALPGRHVPGARHPERGRRTRTSPPACRSSTRRPRVRRRRRLHVRRPLSRLGLPDQPPAATVTIGDARSVAISGAPASMVAAPAPSSPPRCAASRAG